MLGDITVWYHIILITLTRGPPGSLLHFTGIWNTLTSFDLDDMQACEKEYLRKKRAYGICHRHEKGTLMLFAPYC